MPKRSPFELLLAAGRFGEGASHKQQQSKMLVMSHEPEGLDAPIGQSRLAQIRDAEREHPINEDDSNQDAGPLAHTPRAVPIFPQHRGAGNLALRGQLRLVHTLTSPPAIIRAVLEFIHHHSLENISLIVDVMGPVAPEHIQDGRVDEKAADAHPQAIGEGDEGKRDHKVGED